MFDIGFSELLLIGVVALLVLGPERLPKVARTVGSLLGRLNRYVAQVKQDVERDIHLEELRKTQRDMQEQAQRFEIVADETQQTIHQELSQVEKVAEAMSATDGGLAAQEHELIKTEQMAAEEAPPQAQAQLELGLEPESQIAMPKPHEHG